MKKKHVYVIAILLLLGANILMLNTGGRSFSTSFDDKRLAVSDTGSIVSIVIKKEGEQVQIARSAQGWRVNNQYEIDNGFKNTLLAVLSRMKIKREVSSVDFELLGEVTLIGSEERTFAFGSNANRTQSFIVENGKIFEMQLPEFPGLMIDVFQLKKDQWRNRMIFNGNWRSIQNLNISGSHELSIRFDDKFFTIEDVADIDSNTVISYLNSYEFLSANEMISEGNFPAFDSLLAENALATIKIEDIGSDQPFELYIYPQLSNQGYQLVTSSDGDMMVFDSERVRSLLKNSSAFRYAK